MRAAVAPNDVIEVIVNYSQISYALKGRSYMEFLRYLQLALRDMR